MIALALLQAAAPAAPAPAPVPPTLAALAPQPLPARGCAAYLWTLGEAPRLLAVATPARLRLAPGGAVTDLAAAGGEAAGPLGFAASAEYRAAGAAATLALSVVERADLKDGAAVPAATLTLRSPGSDTLVVPLAGLVGCAPAGR